jgi:hypothetical protein
MSEPTPVHAPTAQALNEVQDPVKRFEAAASAVNVARTEKVNARARRAWALFALHSMDRHRWPKAGCYGRYGLTRRSFDQDLDNLTSQPPEWLDVPAFTATCRVFCLEAAAITFTKTTLDIRPGNSRRDRAAAKVMETIQDVQTAVDGLGARLRALPHAAPDSGPMLSELDIVALEEAAAKMVEACDAIDDDPGEEVLAALRSASRPVTWAAEKVHDVLFPQLEAAALAAGDPAHQSWRQARSIERTALGIRNALFRELQEGKYGRRYSSAELSRISGLSTASASYLTTGRANPPKKKDTKAA